MIVAKIVDAIVPTAVRSFDLGNCRSSGVMEAVAILETYSASVEALRVTVNVTLSVAVNVMMH